MAQNLFEKVYNHFKAYYNNGYNLLKKLRDVYFGGPQDVTLQWQDPETGEIHNLVVPSFAKMRDRFISDVNSVMAKTVYVDAEKGSDETGDGSSSAPFKTLQKAIDSIPEGGTGYINVNSDITLDNDVIISNKVINLKFQGHKLLLKPLIRQSGGGVKYRSVAKFFIYDAVLYVWVIGKTGRIEIIEDYPQDYNNAVRHSGAQTIFTVRNGSINLRIRYGDGSTPNLIIPQEFSLFNCGDWWGNSPSPFFGVFTLELAFKVIAKVDGNILQRSGSDAPLYMFAFHAFENSKLIDSSGNEVDVKTKVSGIIKDSNGVPRNIISNIIL